MARATYHIEYKNYLADEIHSIDIVAHNKEEAYWSAVWVRIHEIEGSYPYSAWVESVTYKNGNCHKFNNFEGNPY